MKTLMIRLVCVAGLAGLLLLPLLMLQRSGLLGGM
jgi:hypothetical protein